MTSLLAPTTGKTTLPAPRPALTICLLAILLAVAPAAAFNETGGSGLLRTEQAYSLPIGRPLFSLYAGTYSNDFTPGTSRLFSLTPSVTLGLGAGFEGSAAVSFEGLTTSESEGAFTRRFDVRRRALQTKVRWTSDLGGPRLRGGVMGHLTLPLGEDHRPGALTSPNPDYDTGIMGLLSANVGWFDVPIRVHLNAGYWWSRDDGAFIYRSLPTAIPVTGLAADRNDVLEYGLAVEAGLRRAVVFVELRSEQFLDARSTLAARENLWQVTPGFRTQLSSSVGLTGGIAFDISGNDESTAFDPAASYPDFELKLGLTLGSVLSREHHEASRRRSGSPPEQVTRVADEADQGSWLVPAVEPTPEASAAATVTAAPPAAAPPAPESVPAVAPAPAPAPDAGVQRLRELEERLARVETTQRLAWLEARLAALEGHPLPPLATAAPAVPATAAVDLPTPDAAPATAAVDLPTPDAAPATAAVDLPTPASAPADSQAVAPVAAPAEPTPPPAALVAPVSTVSPEVQAQLDRLQSGLQLLLEQRTAAPTAPVPAETPTAVQPVAAPVPARSTVIVGDGGGSVPVVALPAPTAAASPPPSATAVPEAVLDPALLQPYQPAAVADPTPVTPAPALEAPSAPVAPAPPLGLEIGERRTLAGIDVTVAAPLGAPAALADLDRLTDALKDRPTAAVALLVHGGGADRSEALAETDRLAVLLRDYLVAGGIPTANVVPIGMGHSEDGAARVEIERIR